MNPLILATTTDINLNAKSQQLGDCLKEISNIGNTVYQNICTGQQSVVRWGSADWGLTVMVGLLILGFVTAMYIMFRDI